MFQDYNLDVEKRSVWRIAHPTPGAHKYPFIVNESGVFYARKNFYTKRYAKNDFQILYTVSGAAQLEYDGGQWQLNEGSLVIIDCNKFHDYRTDPHAGHWTYYWIHVGGAYCRKYYETAYKNGFKPHVPGMDTELLSFFEEALEQIDYTTDVAYIRLSNAASSVFTKLIVLLNSALPSAQETIVQEAMSYMKSHYFEPLNIEALAKQLNLSKYYFIKLFARHAGMTPYYYLIHHRINEAKKLLRATDHKVDDIAQSVGFADTSNFSRTFTKLTGMPPGEYRNNK